MKVLQVNCTDLPGSFSGYSLNRELRRSGIEAKQIVLDKYSNDDSVVLTLEKDNVLHQICRWAEDKYSVSNLLYPYGKALLGCKVFLEADIVHYHILHRFMFSLFDYPALMNTKKTVWTIHDPWIITGNCVHPLNCDKWRSGCGGCERLQESGFEMRSDRTLQMWEIKHNILKQINPHIVVATKFMEDYLNASPITNHFNKIQRIPFGVKIENYDLDRRAKIRKQYGLLENEIVVGFRADDNPIKGCSYIFEALLTLEERGDIILATVGNGKVEKNVKSCYRMLEMGWINEENKVADYMLMCDVFLMPSLAESFGYMAIEAMAAETPVICFKETVVEEIIDAPKCGLSVSYKSSEALKEAIHFLKMNRNARTEMGKNGRKRVCQNYLFDEYVNQHIHLYEKIMEE